ncbi:DNA-dependent metalloprotease WSS1-like protein [Golovinomyces cichoracearum]|uniref:DNA-dependent metalloprotease WSS1-like protein n=1 Tax=Golovinomyces cichoracearum TaxID=62708 RepID=A0A420IQC9_9PEZI|nr:DNA-dependent metalloprotease WSS1-like protein [Golovinomyces cichoracearum]
MPLGWERINAKKSPPNQNIVFIKPRPGPDESASKEYLERIAAQCVPIMKKHQLAVVSLEEYEPNFVFWGRNFNNGEVIQLVLKSPSTGRWLPFKFVQMIMMHELAHCKQMNHSKAFWTLRNEYASEMKKLWERGYTGEGLWGKGVSLSSDCFSCQNLEEDEVLPENMCGGIYKTRDNRKRKSRPKLTNKERQQQRIKKKFGTNGNILGANTEIKLELEKKKIPGKPRVAKSIRGRDLRAAAALSRFEIKKEEQQIEHKVIITDDEDESDSDNLFDVTLKGEDALDINGHKILDRKGQGMVKVCEDENQDNIDSKEELMELLKFSNANNSSIPKTGNSNQSFKATTAIKLGQTLSKKNETGNNIIIKEKKNQKISKPQEEEILQVKGTHKSPRNYLSCSACSFINFDGSITCIVCSNVLISDLDPNSWKCRRPTCKENLYLNAGDVNFCGLCNVRK